MTSMSQWTTGQWAVFAVTIVLGLGAIALAYFVRSAVLGWTAPAPLRPVRREPTAAEMRRFRSNWLAARNAPAHVLDSTWSDPMAADFTDPGIGALPSILAVDVDPTLRTSIEISAEEDAWINAYADLSGLMPETDAAREDMRVAIEPAMRTARLWLTRAGETGARAALAEWRMNTPTGEYPSPYSQSRVAHALLAS